MCEFPLEWFVRRKKITRSTAVYVLHACTHQIPLKLLWIEFFYFIMQWNWKKTCFAPNRNDFFPQKTLFFKIVQYFFFSRPVEFSKHMLFKNYAAIFCVQSELLIYFSEVSCMSNKNRGNCRLLKVVIKSSLHQLNFWLSPFPHAEFRWSIKMQQVLGDQRERWRKNMESAW